MTPVNLRAWLAPSAIGKIVHFQNLAAQVQGGGPAPGAPANGSVVLYYPVTVVHQLRANGFGFELAVTGCPMGGHDGVYLPDCPNQCPRVDATAQANGIVISGQFTGCTFARCQTAGGNLVAGHVYVNGALPGNNPVAQARAFEVGAGAPANTAMGFPTIGQVMAPANRGYTIGTLVAGVWQWDWLTVDANNTVVTHLVLGPAHWVAL